MAAAFCSTPTILVLDIETIELFSLALLLLTLHNSCAGYRNDRIVFVGFVIVSTAQEAGSPCLL